MYYLKNKIENATYWSIGDAVVIGIIIASISDAIAISVLLSGIGCVDTVIL